MNRLPLHTPLEVIRRSFARARVLWIVLLSAVALSFSCAAAKAQSFTPPVNVSSDGAGNFPQVIADSDGNVDIAYVDFVSGEPTNGVWFVRGSFSSGTFRPASSPVRVSKNAGSGSFSMALESSCVIDIAYLDQASPLKNEGDIFFAQSSDCGASFTSVNITNSARTYYSHRGPQLVLNQGIAQVVWTATADPTSTETTLLFAQRNSASSFTTPIALATSPSEIQCLEAAATPESGSTDVVWCDGNVEFLNSVNGARPITIGPGGEAQFAVDSEGNVNLVWAEPSSGGSIEFSRSTAQTGVFSAPKTLFAGYDPEIIVDKNGNLDLAYWAGRGAVLFSRSTDGGNNFSAPVTVAPSFSGLGSPAVVQMSAESTGAVDLIWEHPQAPEGILFSRSDIQGASFSTPVSVSANVKVAPSGVAIMTDARNHVVVLWSDKDVFISQRDARNAANGFTISAAPASLTALPGGSVTAKVTLTATSGFDQAVNLSCGNLPAGAECSFAPASVTPSTLGTVVSLTVTIPATLSTPGFPFSVNASTPIISQFQDMQITVGEMTASVTPTAAIIPLGASTSFAVTVSSTGGFAGQFSLACSAPPGVACRFSPTTSFLPINGRVSSIMTVHVLSLPVGAIPPKGPPDNTPFELPSANDVLQILSLAFLLLSAMALAWLRGKDSGYLVRARVMTRIVVRMGLTVALAAMMLSCGVATTTKSTFGTSVTTVGTGGTAGVPGTGGVGGTGGSAGAGGSTSGGVNMPGSTSVTFPLTVMAQSGASVVDVGTVSVTVP
jgi:hypothetical protein